MISKHFIVLMFKRDFNEFWIISEKVEFSKSLKARVLRE